jgi:exopolysaccharide biosynthesis protein
MKNYLLLLVGSLFSSNTLAQTDSATFVNVKWESKTIVPGLTWKHYWFDKTLFDTTENINIISINKHTNLAIALGYEKELLKPVANFAKEANALAAINGSFFDVKNGGAVDVIKFNGEMISTNHLNKNGKRAVHQKAALLFKKGKLSIAKWNENDDWESSLSGDVMNTGPLLIYHQDVQSLDSSEFVKKRHPRTAVAVTRNEVLLITIDGRNANSAGVNLYELTKILKWLNVKDGINLDGGGSTTMWINGQTPNGIVNYPCDNKKWDHDGERKVANVVLVKAK